MFIRDQYLSNEGGGNGIGQRKNLNCDTSPTKPQLTRLGAPEWEVLIRMSHMRLKWPSLCTSILLIIGCGWPRKGCDLTQGGILLPKQSLKELRIGGCLLPHALELSNKFLEGGLAVNTLKASREGTWQLFQKRKRCWQKKKKQVKQSQWDGRKPTRSHFITSHVCIKFKYRV